MVKTSNLNLSGKHDTIAIIMAIERAVTPTHELPNNVTIRQLPPEPGEPEKNSFEKNLKGLMEQAGLITKQRQPVPDEKMKEWVGQFDVEGRRPIRPMAEAEPRAKLYKEVRSVRGVFQKARRLLIAEQNAVLKRLPEKVREDVKTAFQQSLGDLRAREREATAPLFTEGKARQEVLREYLQQREVEVPIHDGTKLMARSAIVHPPETKRTAETDALPSIVLIPGISNDVGSVGNLARELALSGRTVAVIGFPESRLGGMTPKGIDDHKEFFKKAITGLRAYHQEDFGNKPIELWGHSTGALYAAELLNDTDFAKTVTDAVLTSPPGVIEQSVAKMALTGMVEYALTLLRPRTTARTLYNETNRFQPENPTLKKEKNLVFRTLAEHVSKAILPWKTAKVQFDGHITVVSGDMDYVTQSKRVFNLASEDTLRRINDQIRVIEVPRGIHNSPVSEANRLIPIIREKQKYWQ